jgi:hypothetical protein
VQIIIETNIAILENYAYIYMRKSSKIWYNILYSMLSSPPSNARQVGIGRDIGVCIRGKCRKGGAQRLLASFQERIPEAWASVEVQQTLGSRRTKKQIHSSQPCFGGRCWNTAGIALWIGELFNHSKVNSLPGSILQLPCCTIYELFSLKE